MNNLTEREICLTAIGSNALLSSVNEYVNYLLGKELDYEVIKQALIDSVIDAADTAKRENDYFEKRFKSSRISFATEEDGMPI